MIRPAVESALAVARSGLAADPVVPPPVALRPFVGFAKQTPQSLRAIARVVERDDEFRARVVEAVDEAEVGRAGWLWLARPDGWQDELDSLEAESAARSADEAEAREERSATRRLALAQAALQRAEADAAARLAELESLRSELGSEREKRQAADGRVADLEAEVATVTSARAEAVRNLKAAEARAVERGTEVNTLRARVRALEAEARRGGTSGVGHPAPPAPAPSPRRPLPRRRWHRPPPRPLRRPSRRRRPRHPRHRTGRPSWVRSPGRRPGRRRWPRDWRLWHDCWAGRRRGATPRSRRRSPARRAPGRPRPCPRRGPTRPAGLGGCR